MKRRTLKSEEKALWERVARTVMPLHAAPVPPEASIPAIEAAAETPMTKGEAKTAAAPPVAPAKATAPLPKPRVAGDLDRKTRRKLARGVVAIDARIDLHGMTQEEAHGALVRFVDASVTMRRRVVLVITGKGSGGEGRGILRRNVPHWLTSREVARHVVSFGPAHATHGGDGALYVRLRGGAAAGSGPAKPKPPRG